MNDIAVMLRGQFRFQFLRPSFFRRVASRVSAIDELFPTFPTHSLLILSLPFIFQNRRVPLPFANAHYEMCSLRFYLPTPLILQAAGKKFSARQGICFLPSFPLRFRLIEINAIWCAGGGLQLHGDQVRWKLISRMNLSMLSAPLLLVVMMFGVSRVLQLTGWWHKYYTFRSHQTGSFVGLTSVGHEMESLDL